MTAEQVLELLRRLPPRDRVRVIAKALPEIEEELPERPRPAKSPEGLWKDLGFDVTEEDIAEARREMWRNFPREDI
ncbi:MAG: hypothetical protein HPY83_07505 [Anaerolineae bacterium]|nr:hypothetical protein [Anaerolineae bacterium]